MAELISRSRSSWPVLLFRPDGFCLRRRGIPLRRKVFAEKFVTSRRMAQSDRSTVHGFLNYEEIDPYHSRRLRSLPGSARSRRGCPRCWPRASRSRRAGIGADRFRQEGASQKAPQKEKGQASQSRVADEDLIREWPGKSPKAGGKPFSAGAGFRGKARLGRRPNDVWRSARKCSAGRRLARSSGRRNSGA